MTQQDLYMQWYPITGAFDATDSSDLAESEITTGLSIRGNYAWLVHRVELYLVKLQLISADNNWRICLSTETGATTMPDINDAGTICRFGLFNALTTSGEVIIWQPFTWTSFPPTIIASPKLSLYCEMQTDDANFQGAQVVGRIGYTTVPIDAKAYLEIAETFETL